jgi:hypothetical protein
VTPATVDSPLSAASARLRGKPGRPRRERAPADPLAALAVAAAGLPPRLLDVEGSARYLGVSDWTIRDLDAAGVIARVRIPLPNGGELRRCLYDRVDLDVLIESWKERPA